MNLSHTGWILLVVSIIWFGVLLTNEIKCYYEYNNDFESYWDLAYKSSSIAEKYNYINIFVERLDSSGLQGQYDAIYYKTPTLSFDNNLKALKSLRDRLDEIKTMDVSSFEYQTAIQQITAQEQGDARSMLNVLSGTWCKENYVLLWGWFGTINWLLWMVCLCTSIGAFIVYHENNW
jgi:hypothetical protein